MPISITGTGTITGLSAGGLPDDCITTAEIAGSAVTPAKLSGAQTGSAPIYGARAWVNFDGTRNEADTGASTNGANVKIRASGNVSSVLKNAVGDYTVNFTVAMPDANYAVTHVGGIKATSWGLHLRHDTVVPTTSAYRFFNVDPTDTNNDNASINIAVFR